MENLGAKFKIDVSELKAGITLANKLLRENASEFKATAASLGNWQTSTKGVEARITMLNNATKIQQEKVDALTTEYKQLIAGGLDPTSARAVELRTKINNETASLEKNKKELADCKEALSKMTDEAGDTTSELSKLENEIKDNEDRLNSLAREYAETALSMGKNSKEAQELKQEYDNLSEELEDSKNKLKEVTLATEDAGDAADNAQGGFTVFKGALADLAAGAIQTCIDGLKNLVANTVEVGQTFDSSMSKVQALSGATADDMKLLEDTAKQYGSTTKFSASEAADALGYMALAGWDAQTSASALGGVLDLAAASGMDLAAASDMVTDYMSAFGMEADKSSYFADLLAYAQANANTTTEGLGEAFKNCAANMNASGQDIETTTSLLSMMANQGLKGSEAGTALTAVMRDMTSKMKDGAIAIGDATVEVMDANGNYRDMTDILKDVEDATNGMGDAEKAAALQSTFTSDSIKGLNLILNAGVGNAADFEEELRNCDGAAKNMSDTMNDNLNGDMTALSSKLEGVQIAMYEKFEPALRDGVKVLDKLLDAVDFVVDHSTEFTGALIAMATAVGTYVAYTTAMKVMTDGWKALTVVTKAQAAAQAVLNAVMSANPIGIIIAAIAALVAAFIYLWNNCEGFRDFWIGLWDKITEVAGAAWEAISGFFSGAWDKVKEIWGGITDFFSGLWDGIKEIFSTIASWINDNIFQPIINYFQPVIDFFTTAWEIISQLAAGCWELIKAVWSIVSSWFDANIIQPVQNFFTNLWNGIKDAASLAWDGIKAVWGVVSGWFNSTIVQPVANFFGNMWDNLKKGASQAWEGIKSVFSKVADFFGDIFSKAWTKVKNVFSVGGKIFDGIKDGIVSAFKTIVNAIIKGINKVVAVPFNAINGILDKIKGVSVAGIQPFKGLISRFDVPQIPLLAKGGVVRGATQAIIGEAGAEAIVPLENNTQWIKAVADEMRGQLGNTGSGEVVINQTNNYSQAHSRYELFQTKQDTRQAVLAALRGY